ncbi:MAG: SpoIIE family protein phosphatase [Spirochaetota bacterium]|jgi:serine phosphatase RsbU (regulator of sigma subunit)|nr:SpoIIE family protein phosphatase [Spirochaetota bacterium]
MEAASTHIIVHFAAALVFLALFIAYHTQLRKCRFLEKNLHEHQQNYQVLAKRVEYSVAERTDELRRKNVRLSRHIDELEKDAEAGKHIQTRLLPENPMTIGDYHFRYTLYPSHYFSGDFVDWFEIDADHVGFYFADVSGHGLPSSFLTVFLKTLVSNTLEGYTNGNNSRILDPAQLLLYVNGEIMRQHFDKHLTLYYGLLTKSSNTLLCSSGGQYPFPVLISGGQQIPLSSEGAYPLGLFGFADYRNQSYNLPERFALTIASDGFLELMDGEDVLQKEADFIDLCRSGKMSEEDLLRRLKAHGAEMLPDDVTLLNITKG